MDSEKLIQNYNMIPTFIKMLFAVAFMLFPFISQADENSPAQKWTNCVWESHYGLNTTCKDSRTIAPIGNCNRDDMPSQTNNANPACCCRSTTASTYIPPKFVMPDMQIDIPGLNLTPTDQIVSHKNDDGSYSVTIPWIAEYIQAIYNYGLGIVGILAALVLMGGGVLWLVSGGDASKITQAKELIIGSVTGMIILATSYIILFQVNPELTRLKPVSMGAIAYKSFEPDVDSSAPLSLDLNGISKILGVTCGTDTVAQIVNKSKGKVTYNNPHRGKTGPANTVYNDCSGFASFVLKCAKNKSTDSYTGNIFKDQSVWDMDLEKLQPGDLVGWAPKNNKSNFGHVIIYLGDGKFGDCHGGDSGRKTGNCISNNISYESVKKYSTTHSDDKLYFKRY